MPSRRVAVVFWLAGAIVAAHLAAVLLLSQQAYFGLLERFAVIPARYGPGVDSADSLLDAVAPMFAHVFFHAGFLHLGMNLLVFLQVAGHPAARMEEDEPGGLRFLALFFGSGIAGALAYIAINPGSMIPAIGASGAICGVFSAYLLSMGRDWRAALKRREVLSAGAWFLAINVGLAGLARATGFLPIAWEAHLGGFIGGALLYPLLAPKARTAPSPWGA
jgi:membrane associated rhomboid family serine protease